MKKYKFRISKYFFRCSFYCSGGAATECYGVVGMASQKKLKDGFYELLKKENYSKGIIASDGETGLI